MYHKTGTPVARIAVDAPSPIASARVFNTTELLTSWVTVPTEHLDDSISDEKQDEHKPIELDDSDELDHVGDSDDDEKDLDIRQPIHSE